MTDELGWEGLAPPNTAHQAIDALEQFRADTIDAARMIFEVRSH